MTRIAAGVIGCGYRGILAIEARCPVYLGEQVQVRWWAVPPLPDEFHAHLDALIPARSAAPNDLVAVLTAAIPAIGLAEEERRDEDLARVFHRPERSSGEGGWAERIAEKLDR